MFSCSTITRTRSFYQIFCTIAGILLLKSNYYEFSETVQSNYYGNTSAHLLRFRDFEPRFASVPVSSVNENQRSSGSISAGRKSRGFHFHADKEDITVDLEFTVPFMRIPVDRTMLVTTSAFRNLVNLNTGSLLLSGAFVAVGAAVAGVFKVLNSQQVIHSYGYKKDADVTGGGTVSKLMDAFNLVSYKNHSNGSRTTKSVNTANDFMSSMETKLLEHDIDMSACIQKSICGYVRSSAQAVRSGHGSSMAKIIDGLANLELVRSYLSGSAVQKAIDTGRNFQKCDMIYRKCKWPQADSNLIKLIINYLKYFNS